MEFQEQDQFDIGKIKIATVSNKENPAKIFKLDIDCFHEIFEWLSLRDLIAVGNTCKRLQRIAGEFFQLNYSGRSARGENDGIYISSLQSNIFSEYIKKISISGNRLKAYRYIGSNCTNSIKYFRVHGFLPDDAFDCVKDILKCVEVLEMNECFINGEFYENYLKFCPNVKKLHVARSGYIQDKSIIIGTGNEWLLRKYPTLKHFELTDSYELNGNELKTFFEINENINSFSTDARTLWENRHLFSEINVSLDVFAINICQSKIIDSNNQPVSIKDSVYNILVELHKRAFYMRLHLYVYFVDQQNLDKMLSLSSIETLNGDVVRIDGLLADLKTLAICYGDEILNMQNVPKKLLKLERIYFSEITSDRIVPFICYSPKLRQIRIRVLKDEVNFRRLNFFALNKEREKLYGAKKIIIYVNENVCLSTKWTKTTITFSLIEIKRIEMSDWEELSARSSYFKSF